MINLSENEFNKLKNSSCVFPVILKMNADEITPIMIYYNMKGKNKFLLESASSGKNGRYSFIGSNPYKMIRSIGTNVEVREENGNTEKFNGNVLDYVERCVSFDYNSLGSSIPFMGGGVGYAGYDVARQYERIPDKNKKEIDTPESCIAFYKLYTCFDHFNHTLSIIYNAGVDKNENYKDIVNKLYSLSEEVQKNVNPHEFKEKNKFEEMKSNFTKDEFCRMVNKAKEYIAAGDIFQVVLSQRLKFKCSSDPFDVYRRLRSENPSPYLFYMDFGDFQVAGSSPESLVSVTGRRVMTNPIAGSRKRGKDADEDRRLKAELLSDEKERAEHVMLVDLGRNDIGKISKFGSVKVDKFMEVNFYSHIMHIASEVSGELKDGLTCFDALKSCLPVGTVSGAPKIRAMEIIDELENVKRGIYAGAFGYFSYNGNMNTCIAIRTVVFKDKNAYVQSGAGIVYDSCPESEYQETFNKAAALREVI